MRPACISVTYNYCFIMLRAAETAFLFFLDRQNVMLAFPAGRYICVTEIQPVECDMEMMCATPRFGT